MSALWMFVTTVACGGAFLMIAEPLLRGADRAGLRAGLWINGIEGSEANAILKWHDGQPEAKP